MGINPISCKCLKTCKDANEEVDLANIDYLRSKIGNYKINNAPNNLTLIKKMKSMSINSILLKPESITNLNNNNNENGIKETLKNYNVEQTEENNFIETNNGILKTVNTLNNKNKNNINTEENDNKEQKSQTGNDENNEKSIISKENKDDNESSSNTLKKKKNDEKKIGNRIIKENNDDEENSDSLGSIKINKKVMLFKENTNQNSSSSIKYEQSIDKNIFFTEKLKKAEKNFEHPINYEKDWTQYCDDQNNEDMFILIDAMNSNKGENHTPENGQVIELNGEKCLYIGDLDKKRKPIGFGVLYTIKGAKYEGNFSKGKLIGLGRYINEDGVCYEGIFENNKLVGKAKIIECDEKGKKHTYFGDTINFQKNGKGEEICDEFRYIGEFSGNLRHGYGREEFLKQGEVYEGEFNKGEITGKGTYIWNNKNIYKGDFVKKIKHGKGIYKWPDGFEYEGEYNNGIREGFGTYKYKDGRILKARFKNGTPDGKGKMTFEGSSINVEYKDGKLIQTEEYKSFMQKVKNSKSKKS